jgi:hypothetical protein
MKKTAILLLALTTCFQSFTQNLSTIYLLDYQKNAEEIAYDFTPYQIERSTEEKLEIYLNELISTHESLCVFHGLYYLEDSIYYYKKDSILNNPDEWLLKQANNLVFIDLNNNGNKEIVADLHDEDWIVQFIFIAFKEDNNYRFKEIQGNYILDYELFNDTVIFLSWEAACCDNVYQYFHQTKTIHDSIHSSQTIAIHGMIDFPNENEMLKVPSFMKLDKDASIYFKATEIEVLDANHDYVSLNKGDNVLHIASRKTAEGEDYYYVRYYDKLKLGFKESIAVEGWINAKNF